MKRIKPNGYYTGNAQELSNRLPDESIDCIVTSPPYWSLRSYLPARSPAKKFEIGVEDAPSEYVAKLVSLQ